MMVIKIMEMLDNYKDDYSEGSGDDRVRIDYKDGGREKSRFHLLAATRSLCGSIIVHQSTQYKIKY